MRRFFEYSLSLALIYERAFSRAAARIYLEKGRELKTLRRCSGVRSERPKIERGDWVVDAPPTPPPSRSALLPVHVCRLVGMLVCAGNGGAEGGGVRDHRRGRRRSADDVV